MANSVQDIQKTLDRLFEGNVNAYFQFRADHKLKLRPRSYTNPKALPDQPNDYALFQGTFDLKAGKWTQSSTKKPKSSTRSKPHTRTIPPST